MAAMAPLMLIGGLASIAGGAVSAIGAQQEAQANQQAALASADAAQANKIIANQDRVQALATAKLDQQDKTREDGRTLAAMRASFGANGGDMMGSPIEVLEDNAREMATGELRLGDEARARNREYGIQMIEDDRDKTLALSQAKYAKQAGNISAFSYLLGGISTGLTRMA